MPFRQVAFHMFEATYQPCFGNGLWSLSARYCTSSVTTPYGSSNAINFNIGTRLRYHSKLSSYSRCSRLLLVSIQCLFCSESTSTDVIDRNDLNRLLYLHDWDIVCSWMERNKHAREDLKAQCLQLWIIWWRGSTWQVLNMFFSRCVPGSNSHLGSVKYEGNSAAVLKGRP